MAPSMRNRTWIFAIVGVAFLAGLVVSLAGDLEPPGPPAPTMETLIRADDMPLNITVPGSYAFAEDITTAGGGISIAASNVTIDLRGHRLEGGTGDGIATTVANLRNIVVKNGIVRQWSSDGVDFVTMPPLGAQVLGVHAEANILNGIRVSTGGLVSGCASIGNFGDGFVATGSGGTFVDSDSVSNGGNGINVTSGAWTIRGCTALSNTGIGIGGAGSGTTIQGCAARDNNGDGFVLGQGASIYDSSAYSNGDSAGDDGITSASGGTSVVRCSAVNNFEDGIELAFGSFAQGNTARGNGGAGITLTSSGNRIEENNVTGNTGDGINANPASGNFILRNSATGNSGIAFDLAAGNSYGAIVAGAAGFSNSNSWANYTY